LIMILFCNKYDQRVVAMVHIYGGPLVPREKTFSQIIIVILFKTPYISLYVFLIRFVTARIKIKTSID